MAELGVPSEGHIPSGDRSPADERGSSGGHVSPGDHVPSQSDVPGVLSADTIRQLLQAEPPLVGWLADPERQIQPNGIDLTLESVWRMGGRGEIGIDDDERVIPDRVPVDERDGAYELVPGSYIIRLVEPVALPRDVMAFGRPRSSLLRCGVGIHTAVWDAGYAGRSEALLVVYNPDGFRVRRRSRVLQLVFLTLNMPTTPYAGRYQGENL